MDVQVAPIVTVDGKSVPVTEVETSLLNITLPADNILEVPGGGEGLSVAHGWVTLLHPLTPGTHTIVIDPTWRNLVFKSAPDVGEGVAEVVG